MKSEKVCSRHHVGSRINLGVCTRKFFLLCFLKGFGVLPSVWDPFCFLLKGPIESDGNLTCGERQGAGTGTEAAVCRIPARQGAVMKYTNTAATRRYTSPMTQWRQTPFLHSVPHQTSSIKLHCKCKATPVDQTSGKAFHLF